VPLLVPSKASRRELLGKAGAIAAAAWAVPSMRSVRILGADGSPPPTSTTSTTPPPTATRPPSAGCVGMNDPTHDAFYSSRTQTGQFHAGDRISISGANLVPGTVDTFTVSGPEFGTRVVPLGGTFTHTFQADTSPFFSVVSWLTNVGLSTRWTVSCAHAAG
jgi:hypothetical protein